MPLRTISDAVPSLESYAKSDKGFTLVELLVVLSIIIIITTVVLTSQSSFNRTLILTNTAYDIALSLRSAQTYGLSSRANAGGVSAVNAGYGIHLLNGTTGSYTLFADFYPSAGGSNICHPLPPPFIDSTGPDAKPGNCLYDEDRGERVLEYTLGNGITISDFCALSSGNNPKWSCANSDTNNNNGNAYGYGNKISSLDIVFLRPNSETFLRMKEASNNNPSFATAACLVVTSPQGGERYVGITSSGQITANAAQCPW